MTNEQLAILLEVLHNQLVSIFNSLSDQLKKDCPDIECHTHEERGKWIGKGEEPLYDFSLLRKNYEWVEVKDDPMILDELSEFIDSLSGKVDTLE